MVKKTDIVRELVRRGRYREALRIAKDFRLGITPEQHDSMARGYECMLYPDFYSQIGKNAEECVKDGVETLVSLYGETV